MGSNILLPRRPSSSTECIERTQFRTVSSDRQLRLMAPSFPHSEKHVLVASEIIFTKLYTRSFYRMKDSNEGEECVCKMCASESQSRFPTEIAVHLPGLTTPQVFLFLQVVICIDCGFTGVCNFRNRIATSREQGFRDGLGCDGVARNLSICRVADPSRTLTHTPRIGLRGVR